VAEPAAGEGQVFREPVERVWGETASHIVHATTLLGRPARRR
jgi:hypothetical protein